MGWIYGNWGFYFFLSLLDLRLALSCFVAFCPLSTRLVKAWRFFRTLLAFLCLCKFMFLVEGDARKEQIRWGSSYSVYELGDGVFDREGLNRV